MKIRYPASVSVFAARRLLPMGVFATAAMALALLAGCTAAQRPGAPAASQAPAAPAQEATGVTGSWQLLSWAGNDARPLPPGRDVVLTFNDGQLSGTGGCNRIFGTYKLGPGNHQISLGQPASTRMACPDSLTFESHFLALLPRINRFERTDTTLALIAPGGDRLTFAHRLALDDNIASNGATAPAPVQERVIEVDSRLADCTGVAPRKCLRVRSDASQPWALWYAPIDGFKWQPGVKYRLRIRGERVDNPPADASNMRWTLVEVLERSTPGNTH